MIGLANWLNKFRKIPSGGGGGGGSQYVLGNHTTANAAAGATATTSGIDSSGANLIIIAAFYYQAGSGPTITDSKGNTWTALTAFGSSGGTIFTRLYYCINPTVGTGHTFSLTASYSIVNVACYSVAGRTPVFDQQSGFNRTEGSQIGSFSPGSLTPSVANALVVISASWDNTGITATGIDQSFVITDQHQQGSNAASSLQAYLAQTTATLANPTVTFSASTINACSGAIAVFK